MKTKSKEYEFHPLCLLFPQMPDDQLQQLADNIKETGLRESIKLHEGKILDGRNRFISCGIAGVKPRFEKFSGKDALDFVISENLHRRHLNDSQRAMIGAEIAKLKQGQKSNPQICGSQDEAAAALNVSKRSIQTAKKLNRTASTGVKKLVRAGKLSLNAAAKVSHLSKAKQSQIAARGPQAVKNAAARLTKLSPAQRPAAYHDPNLIYTSASNVTRGAKPPPREIPPAPLKLLELAPVKDAASAILRLETIYERDKVWFNEVPPRTPRVILDRLIEGLRE